MLDFKALIEFMEALETLGFGTEDPINGADTVDVVNRYYSEVKRLVNLL